MNRTTIMKFRATEEEAAEIRRKANAAGMTVSRFLRTAAVNSQVVLYNTADIFGLRSDLKRIGNNINQIAKAVNTYGLINSKVLSDMKTEHEKVLKKVEKCFDKYLEIM